MALLLLLAALQDPQAPPGWSVSRAAGARFPMFACLDDAGRLYVTESSGGDLYEELRASVRRCRIRRFEDRDRDGVYETSVVFAEKLVPSMGLAWRDGRLYAADPPDLAVFTDSDGDGRADRRDVILTGFGHTDNGSLHGLVFGPDGLLYLTTGEPDGYRIRLPGGGELRGKSGVLMRCRPDGSRPEVVSRGFENLIEVAFLPGGDIVGTCNWYQEPAGGARDALVHLLDGARFPYAPEEGTRQPWTGRLLPPLALFPAVAFSGLCRHEGAAFPDDGRGRLFAAQFNSRKVSRHLLVRSGSTYAAESSDFLTSSSPDFHPSDVLEDRDGSLLVLDTGAWYTQHCPTGRIRASEAPGGIWRVRWTGAPGPPAPSAALPAEPAAKLPDPAAARALARFADRNAAPALEKALASPKPELRLAAAEALAACGRAESVAPLLGALAEDADAHLEHALVHALHRLAPSSALESALRDESPRVRRAAMVLLDGRDALGPDAVAALAGSGDAGLREAAIGILRARPAWASTAAALVARWLEAPDPPADALRGCILAFAGTPAVREAVGAALGRAPAGVRVLLLDTLAASALDRDPGGLAACLAHPDAAVRHAAVCAVASLGLPGFGDALAAIGEDPVQPEPLRLDALRASRRASPAAVAFLAGLAAPGRDASLRLCAAEALARLPLAEADLAGILDSIRGDALLSPSIFAEGLRRATGPAIGSAAAAIRAGWRPSPAEAEGWIGRVPADARDLVEKAREEALATLARKEPLLEGGDPERGRAIFFGPKAGCGACHAVGARGGRVGPDLTKIGQIRAGRDLLESILLPSSTFAQGYEPYLAFTKDGEVRSGLVASRSADAVVLRDASGAETRLRRDAIRDLRRAEKSVMPEGLDRGLSDADLRDLLAYLKSLR